MVGGKPAKRSCATCRDRRILCDRTTPSCRKCLDSGRTCKGYALRLSWPRQGDSKRAVLATPRLPTAPAKQGVRKLLDERLVHVSDWDIKLHFFLARTSHKDAYRSRVLPLLLPSGLSPITVDLGNGDLFQYFEHAASQSLTTLDQDRAGLGHVLMRLALAGDTPSAAAVRHSLLALASLHRYGACDHSFSLKIAGVQALVQASGRALGVEEAIQHVAAGMLLCSFEIHRALCTSSQWTWYLSGVKDMLNAGPLRPERGAARYHYPELAALLAWVEYHEVMARFVLRHWRADAAPGEVQTNSMCYFVGNDRLLQPKTDAFTVPATASHPARSILIPSGSRMLDLLSAVSALVPSRPSDGLSGDALAAYQESVLTLDQRIRESRDPAEATTSELYRLAALVYLHRVSRDLLPASATSRTQEYVDRGFELLSRAQSCERQFPLLVLGCEARTDEQRGTFLELLARTERAPSSRSLNFVRLITGAIWAQDDLADWELDYWDKLSCIISVCRIVPSFV